MIVACGAEPPQLQGLADRKVAVGEELEIVIVATDSNGDSIAYSFTKDRATHIDASLTLRPDGAGVFRWRPTAQHLGTWVFSFEASDGALSSTTTIQVEVVPAIGGATAPSFKTPLGSGTLADFEATRCLQLDISVTDTDSAEVTIAQEDPPLPGRPTLKRTGNHTATWQWCPKLEELQANSYHLRLSADDNDNAKVIKDFTIVIKSRCEDGTGPQISHTPRDVDTVLDVPITIDVTDNIGVRDPPTVRWSRERITDGLDSSRVTLEQATRISGDMKHSTWEARIPNPARPGESAQLFYIVTAVDNDLSAGVCNHTVLSEQFSITVTNPGDNGGVGLCESCSSDQQCGAKADDLCVKVGTHEETFCLRSCSDGSCPSGYTCSPAPVTSIDGAAARQCLPDSRLCTPALQVCTADEFEENNTLGQADNLPFLEPGEYSGLTSCAEGSFRSEEDWYPILLTERSRLNAIIVGNDTTDLDLRLFDDAGLYVAGADDFLETSVEEIDLALNDGVYYLWVGGFYPIDELAHNEYSLNYTLEAHECEDDGFLNEQGFSDDTVPQARQTNIFPHAYVSTTNAICHGDVDWFRIPVHGGDIITATLTYDPTLLNGELQISIYDDLLLPIGHGTWDGTTKVVEFVVHDFCDNGCNYFAAVDGLGGTAENLYDIHIAHKGFDL